MAKTKARKPQHAAALRAYLQAAKLSQSAFARQLGIQRSHLSMILSGTRTPSLELAARIERETGVPAVSLVSANAA